MNYNSKNYEIEKEKFLSKLLNDKDRQWKFIVIDNKILQYLISSDGIIASLISLKYMKACKNANGYLATILRAGNNHISTEIHRLVAKAFIPNPENKPVVNHKNGIKTDNRVENLEWCTYSENTIHAIEYGLRKQYLPKKLSETKVHKICQLLEKSKSASYIAKKLKVSKSVVKAIRRGKSWKHISKLYDIPELRKINNNLIKEQTSTTIESLNSNSLLDPIDEEDIEEMFYYGNEIESKLVE